MVILPEPEKMKRNRTIDVIKHFVCIGVVLIHYNWSNDIGVLFIKTISRFAVPFFFFVSGYYLAGTDGKITPKNTRRKILHGKVDCFIYFLRFLGIIYIIIHGFFPRTCLKKYRYPV